MVGHFDVIVPIAIRGRNERNTADRRCRNRKWWDLPRQWRTPIIGTKTVIPKRTSPARPLVFQKSDRLVFPYCGAEKLPIECSKRGALDLTGSRLKFCVYGLRQSTFNARVLFLPGSL